MTIANHEKPRWPFYLGWVVLNVLAVILAWFISWELMGLITAWVGDRIQIGGQFRFTEDFLFFYVLFPVIGLLTGLFQYYLLRRFVPLKAGWIAATIVGWLSPFVIGSVIINLLNMSNGTVSIMFGLMLMGIVIAIPQWWMLRRRIWYAYGWILAYGIGWGLTGLFSLVTSEPFPILLVAAWLPAVTSGFACWLLLDRLPRQDGLKSSIA